MATKPIDRRPDWTSREFWEWAITHCQARSPVLHGWFPYVSRATWDARKTDGRASHPDLPWPVLSRSNKLPEFPPSPPGGWPAERGAQTFDAPGEATYKESVEITSDGGYKSDRLIEMSAEQAKDPAYLLEAHGFDVTAWEIITAKNNIWNVYSKGEDGHDVSTLYSSKITVRPLKETIDVAAIAEALSKVAPVKVASPRNGRGLLEVANSDMHFGNSTLEWYRDSLGRTLDIIRGKKWAEVVLPIGSDLFHCDNFKNTTSNGTAQSSVDWPTAWSDALAYYSTIIEAALAQSKRVYAYYVIGNHDESMSWAFCQMLEAKYPQLVFDTSIAERKVHTFGTVAIGMTHGDGRTRRDLDRVFVSEFQEFAKAEVREVHAGHYHHEQTVDQFGVVVRSLSTAARTDKWHREEGYVGACKRFSVFEYEPDALRAIYYV